MKQLTISMSYFLLLLILVVTVNFLANIWSKTLNSFLFLVDVLEVWNKITFDSGDVTYLTIITIKSWINHKKRAFLQFLNEVSQILDYLYKLDTSLNRTLGWVPDGVRLREVLLYIKISWHSHQVLLLFFIFLIPISSNLSKVKNWCFPLQF